VNLRLQPLRIPSGWTVASWNRFYELDPPSSNEEADGLKKYFTEDLLALRHDERDRILDVGWYPDEDVEHGTYTILVYEGDYWGPELHTFSTRDRTVLVSEIERLMYDVTRGAL
jgi:hypothetical protein